MTIGRRAVVAGLAGVPLLLGSQRSWAKTDWDTWADLLNWLPQNADLDPERQARGDAVVDYEVQRIERAKSEKVNLDFYSIDVEKLPPGVTDKQLLVHVRKNLNGFLDPNYSTVAPYDDDDARDWVATDAAPLGAIMQFNIPVAGPVHEEAAVITSKSDGRSWVFTPVTIGMFSPGEHPVSGNREFALLPAGNGLAARLYTRGADRAVDALIDAPESVVYDGGDSLWRSFQSRVAEYVNTAGGVARVGKYYFKRPFWADVVASGVFTRA